MVWAALIYALVGSVLTHLIGRPLIGLDFNQQRFEADFRFSLVRLRENSEGVALYRGEREELGGLRQRFDAVMANWWKIMLKQKQLTWFTSFYRQLAIIFPLVVVSPRFFSGQIPLGGIFQTASAFSQVQGALSWFITAYRDFAMWKATVNRLIGFADALGEVQQQAGKPAGERIADGDEVSLEQLSLQLPHGGALLSNASLAIKPHDDVLDHRAFRLRQIDAVPRARGHLAVLERPNSAAERREASFPATEALPADWLAEAGGRLPRRPGEFLGRAGAGSAGCSGPVSPQGQP